MTNYSLRIRTALLLVSGAALLPLCGLARSVEPCSTNWCEVVQGPTGTITYTNIEISPGIAVCLGNWICAWVDADIECSQVITVSKWAIETTNCPAQYYTNTSCPYFTTNWWVLNYPGASDSGEGSVACFLPTNCGQGSFTFSGTWKNSDPCTGQPIGGGTISKSINFKVINLEITPSSTNALINRCQDPNRSVTFCLTNSCYPGGVTWSLSPTLTNGATISGSGGCATVKIGDAVQDYTITATSNDNTNCVAAADLQVGRDCVCTNHNISANSSDAPGLSTNSPGCGTSDNFSYGTFTSTCGTVLSLGCSGSVYYSVDGSTVGHCPYLASQWWARYWLCQCGEVIMKTEFQVENVAPFTLGPGPGKGKVETWTCSAGFNRWCYETVNGQRVDRTGGCNGGDN
jgi:hypothetical protein